MAPDRDHDPTGEPGPTAATGPETSSLSPETLDKLRRGFPLHMDRQGNFSFEGDPLSHPGIVRLFRRNLDVSEDGEITVGLDGKWVYLKLDDLPLRALRVDEPGPGEALPQLLLDDGRRVALEPATLSEDPDGGLRCTVPSQPSGQAIPVRLSNSAAVDLSRWIVDDGEDGGAARPVLEFGGQRWIVPERSTE